MNGKNVLDDYLELECDRNRKPGWLTSDRCNKRRTQIRLPASRSLLQLDQPWPWLWGVKGAFIQSKLTRIGV
jgi:hypothetical protein